MGITVQTTDEVRFDLQIAGIGSRVLAYAADSAVKYGFILLVAVVTHLFRPGYPFEMTELRSGIQILLVLAIVAVQWGYFWLFEWLRRGETPGKRLMGIVVIKENGDAPGMVASAVRNLLRYLDWPGVGLVLMFIHPRCRRIGDLAAGTLVVYQRRRGLDFFDGGAGTDQSGLPSVALSADEYELLCQYQARRDAMTPEARQALAQRLASTLQARVPGLPEFDDPDALIQRILASARVVRNGTRKP